MRGMGQLKVKLASNVNKRLILEQRPCFMETSACSVVQELNCSGEACPGSSCPGIVSQWDPLRWLLEGHWEPVAGPATIRLYNPVLQVGEWPHDPASAVNSSPVPCGFLLFGCSGGRVPQKAASS